MNLLEIPTEQFPLNYQRYNHIMGEIRDAARGFEYLNRMGWPNGKELDSKLMSIHAQLNDVWNLVQETERQLAASVSSKK